MAFTISTTNDNRMKNGRQMIDLNHNQREREAVEKANFADRVNGREEHIDSSLSYKNEYLKNETIEEAYTRIMSPAIETYNSRQKKNSRKTSVEKEMEKIENSSKQELCYEILIQVGNRDEYPDEETCRQIFHEFINKWEERYPNLDAFNVAMHFDETSGTPHMHVDYIPLAYGCRKGLAVQNGLRKAFEEMGFENREIEIEGELVLDRQNGAKTQWITDCNQMLEEICREHGLEVEHPLAGKDRKHMDKAEYIEMQEEITKLKNEKEELGKELKMKKKENVLTQRKNLQLENENANLEAEKQYLQGEVQQLKQQTKEMAVQLQAASTALTVANENLKGFERKKEQLLDELEEEAQTIQMPEPISDNLVTAFEKVADESFEAGAGGESKATAIQRALRHAQKPLEDLKTHENSFLQKFKEKVAEWRRKRTEEVKQSWRAREAKINFKEWKEIHSCNEDNLYSEEIYSNQFDCISYICKKVKETKACLEEGTRIYTTNNTKIKASTTMYIEENGVLREINQKFSEDEFILDDDKPVKPVLKVNKAWFIKSLFKKGTNTCTNTCTNGFKKSTKLCKHYNEYFNSSLKVEKSYLKIINIKKRHKNYHFYCFKHNKQHKKRCKIKHKTKIKHKL